MRIKIKFTTGIISLFLLLFSNSVFAAGPPAPSLFSNGLAVALLSLMVVLLIVIGILANILTGAAEVKVKKKAADGGKVAMLIGLLFIAPSLVAQDVANNAVTTATTIGGLSKGTFYLMIGIILVELLVIIAMLINLRFLINKEKEQQLTMAEKAVVRKRESK
jgi:cytochrome c oxidase cbb3-type subunit 3